MMQGCMKFFKDEKVNKFNEFSAHSHIGRFMWMDDSAKKEYLSSLNKKISEGYYSSDRILSNIVEDLAPVFDKNVNEQNLY
jgi:hypothetical protein